MIWKVRDRRHGRDREQSLGTKDKSLAERRYGQWLTEKSGDRWGEVVHTFDAAVEKMLAEHLPMLRPKSVKAYTTHPLALVPVFEGKALADISRADLYAYE